MFFLRDADFQSSLYPVPLALILASGTLLVLSFISALRAMTIRYSESLFIHSVIENDSETFRNYELEFHAKGLLSCASTNASLNDHIAQFVKDAYTLLAIAVICFALSVGIIGGKLVATKDLHGEPVKTGTVVDTDDEKTTSPSEKSIVHSE